MRLLTTGLAGVILGTSLLAGCATSDQVFYYQRSVVGIDASASTAEAAGSLTVGFRRRFIAYVPPVGSAEGDEAMSVVSCVDLRSTNLFGFSVNEAMATGDAANAYASQLSGQNPTFFDCFKIKPPAQTG